jgi:hypothetical protein
MVIDRKLEHKLQNKDLFYVIMDNALSKLTERNRTQILEVMEMRLGHATGYVMKWKHIKQNTYALHDNTRTVSMMYCHKLYLKGLELARSVLEKECQ